MKERFSTVLALLFLCTFTQAQTIRYVKTTANGGSAVANGLNWNTASNDLQAMINASSAGDQVWVAEGTYIPRRRADDMSEADSRYNAFVMMDGVKIFGGFAGGEVGLIQRDSTGATRTTILSGDLGVPNNTADNAYHVVICSGVNNNAELNGFTVTLGTGDLDNDITVNNNQVVTYAGGGIYCTGSNALFRNLIVTRNSSRTGGGILALTCSNVFERMLVVENTAYLLTGGMHLAASTDVVRNSEILKNYSHGEGGGVSIFNPGGTAILENVRISGNHAEAHGGGVVAIRAAILKNVVITGNYAGTYGGGYAVQDTPIALINCTISGNIAGIAGGGGASLLDYTASHYIQNSIIAGNRRTDGSDNNFRAVTTDGFNHCFFNCLIDGLSEIAGVDGSGAQGTGSIDAAGVDVSDIFVNPETVAVSANTLGDYRLKDNDLTVNRGLNERPDHALVPLFLMSHPDDLKATTDIDGFARVYGGTVDLGAYESRVKIAFVTEQGSGSRSGEDWANAMDDLQRAIDMPGVNQVWVAGGTYKPRRPAYDAGVADPSNRDNAFVLKDGVKVYGGFRGDETQIIQWDSTGTTHVSILSGDLGVPGSNVYHVVLGAGLSDATELNRFTIQGGQADGTGELEVGNELFPRSLGGGIALRNASPRLGRLVINGNSAVKGGGMSHDAQSAPALTNVLISGNKASGDGGGIFNAQASPVLTNVTLSGNSAANGGAMYNGGQAAPRIRNSIIYGNSSGIYNDGGAQPQMSYSLVQGLAQTAGNVEGNLDGDSHDPLFVAPLAAAGSPFTGGDYRLQGTVSPAWNKGNNAFFSPGSLPDLSAVQTDLDCIDRVIDRTVDMGAYEVHGSKITYVTVTGNGDRSGRNWENAMSDLQEAIDKVGVEQVWVAEGVYKPVRPAYNRTVIDPDNRDNAFVLKKDVKIYGGFRGDETGLTQRPSAGAVTVLSGDLGISGASDDNACHVVISAGEMGIAGLDGFTVRDGNANGTGSFLINRRTISRENGGAIYSGYSSLPLSNLEVTENYAHKRGGGIFMDGCNLPLHSVSISHNTAGDDGGGIFSVNSSLVIDKVLINGNKAAQGGGTNCLFTQATISDTQIEQNEATTGGGIFHFNSETSLTRSVIRSNRSNSSGGGIYNASIYRRSIITITNTLISENTSKGSGGGVFADHSKVTIDNCTVSRNTSEENGGGIFGKNAVDITHSTIRENTARGNGGGIFCSEIGTSSPSSLTIAHSGVSNNTARGNGGGIYIFRSGLTLTRVMISGNSSESDGGGIYNTDENNFFSNRITDIFNLTFTNVTISGNSSRNGGGICHQTMWDRLSYLNLTNSTISGNKASENGGGFYCRQIPIELHERTELFEINVRNSIISGNSTGVYINTGGGEDRTRYSHSLIQGLSDITNGNIAGTTDPRFVNPVDFNAAPTTAGNYRLQFTSPVIDKGNNTVFASGQTPDLSGITVDADSLARIFGEAVDLGAYEFFNPAMAYNPLYVEKGATGTGNSWDDALGEVADALLYARIANNYTAENPLKIFVARGTYKPMYHADDNEFQANGNRHNGFVMVRNVQLFGGFDPEGDITELSHNRILPSSGQDGTVLSGDIGSVDGNAYSVVIAAGDVGIARLDGFTITGGNADLPSGSITVNEQVFQRNFGGGVCNWRSSPVLTNLLITGNAASYLGAGIYNYFAMPVLTNAAITGNHSTVFGGGGYNVGSDIMMTNVTISGNTSVNNGKEWYNASGAPVIRNSIIWGNGVFGQLSDTQYSLVQNQSEGGNPNYFLSGNKNLPPATDPQFVNPAGGDFRLAEGSLGIDAGNNDAYGDLTGAKDLAGNPRLSGDKIDMGAYEFRNGGLPVTLVSFKAQLLENLVLLSWQTTEEVNASHFEVQRSADARTWQSIGSVIAKGSGSYTFTDNPSLSTLNRSGDRSPLSTFNFPFSTAAAAALNYYRLKTIDLDGTYAYSEIRSVSFKKAGNVISQDNLYPNPSAKGMVILETASGLADPAIRVFDGLGRDIQVRITGGSGKYFLETAGLASGMYYVHVLDGKERQTMQLVVTD